MTYEQVHVDYVDHRSDQYSNKTTKLTVYTSVTDSHRRPFLPLLTAAGRPFKFLGQMQCTKSNQGNQAVIKRM